jgi:hypothetical protein
VEEVREKRGNKRGCVRKRKERTERNKNKKENKELRRRKEEN